MEVLSFGGIAHLLGREAVTIGVSGGDHAVSRPAAATTLLRLMFGRRERCQLLQNQEAAAPVLVEDGFIQRFEITLMVMILGWENTSAPEYREEYGPVGCPERLVDQALLQGNVRTAAWVIPGSLARPALPLFLPHQMSFVYQVEIPGGGNYRVGGFQAESRGSSLAVASPEAAGGARRYGKRVGC